MILKLKFLAVLLFMSFPTNVFATGEISCKAMDGRSGSIFLSIGRLPVLNILSAEVRAFGKTWSTNKDAENSIIVGQAFETKTQLLVDFTDNNVEEILISLRTVKVTTKKEYAEAGVLRIGEATYPVVCESG